jgi:hypothetical protein
MRATVATMATLLALALAGPSTGFAAKKADARSFNECVQLAKQRGFTAADRVNSDTGIQDTAVRRFVVGCMQGKQS